LAWVGRKGGRALERQLLRGLLAAASKRQLGRLLSAASEWQLGRLLPTRRALLHEGRLLHLRAATAAAALGRALLLQRHPAAAAAAGRRPLHRLLRRLLHLGGALGHAAAAARGALGHAAAAAAGATTARLSEGRAGKEEASSQQRHGGDGAVAAPVGRRRRGGGHDVLLLSLSLSRSGGVVRRVARVQVAARGPAGGQCARARGDGIKRARERS
jgi:hypothetical protein